MSLQGRIAFKRLLGAVKELTGDDVKSWRRAREEVRTHFLKNRNVTNGEHLSQLFKDAKEAEDFIKFNIVQARKKKPNMYSVKLKDPNAMDNQEQQSDHVNFEPLPPQEAIEKSTNNKSKSKPGLDINIKSGSHRHS